MVLELNPMDRHEYMSECGALDRHTVVCSFPFFTSISMVSFHPSRETTSGYTTMDAMVGNYFVMRICLLPVDV
jgi:hypothetical protein